jgi:hypothetical protein
MHRRRFLAGVGTVTTGVIAGCLNSFGETDTSAMQLGWLGVSNFDTEPQTFELRVVRDDERVHSSTVDVSGLTEGFVPGHVAECTWDNSKGKYTVAARVDRKEWAEQRLSKDLDEHHSGNFREGADCAAVSALYDQYDRGRFRFHITDCTRYVSGYEGGCAFANEM